MLPHAHQLVADLFFLLFGPVQAAAVGLSALKTADENSETEPNSKAMGHKTKQSTEGDRGIIL